MNAALALRPFLRPRRPPSASLRWIGSGAPVFIGDHGWSKSGKIVKIGNLDELRGSAGKEKSRSEILLRAIEDYFRLSSTPCYVLNVPGLEILQEGRAAYQLLGDDAGPGYRSGLHALGDIEAAGILAAPGIRNSHCHEVLLEYCRLRPSKALLLEGAADSPAPRKLVEKLRQLDAAEPKPTLPLLDRVGWLSPASGVSPAGESSPLGAALGLLEASQYRPGAPLRSLPALAAAYLGQPSGAAVPELRLTLASRPFNDSLLRGFPTLGGGSGSLWTWQLWEGCRKSIDMGTRWVLQEILDEFLCRRVRRELRGFLGGLYRDGILGGESEDAAYRISVQTASTVVGKSEQGALEMKITIQLRSFAPSTRSTIQELAI